jgi:predicted phosphodiesterase
MRLLVVMITLIGVALCAPYDTDYFCAECQDAMVDFRHAIESNATDTKIVKALEKLCHKLPAKAEAKCIAAVEELAPKLNESDISIVSKYSPLALCAAASMCRIDCCATPYLPEQIHIAAQSDEIVMVVSWVTQEPFVIPVVMYGTSESSLTQQQTARSQTYKQGGWRGTIHVATLTNLQPGARYYYAVGDIGEARFWSDPYVSQPPYLNFVTSSGRSSSARTLVAVVGDAGATDVSDLTYNHLTNWVQSREINITVHVGDISYSDGYEVLADAFSRKIEPVAAYAPYMTVQGNHEGFYDFTPYITRFPMPFAASASSSPLWYSFNYGAIHFVAFNTEGPFGLEPVRVTPSSPQYQWLEKDLAAANVSRGSAPWIVAFGHRPLYCVDGERACSGEAAQLRSGFEALFVKYGVDLVLSGHEHNYQAMYPTLDGEATCSGSDSCFNNPAAPVYVLNGAAGNKEHLRGSFPANPPDFSRKNLKDYGYGLIDAKGSSSLTYSFFASEDGSLLDTFTITKAH